MEEFGVFKTVSSLREKLDSINKNTPVAFVPTMGALHHGHLELVKKAFESTSCVVVSIFVNPTQFNNADDLAAYPRTLENDLRLLKTVGDVLVFAPTVDEVYPPQFREINLRLGALEEVMEGHFRPGHFKGVVNVVNRLFEIVQPDYAFFGLKDFQQLAVIRFMVEEMKLPVKIVPCETVRETSGLASSSRNMRLSPTELEDATLISSVIDKAKEWAKSLSPEETQRAAKKMFEASPLKLEYLEIVDPNSLQKLEKWVEGSRMCIAAWCGAVRLIDNDLIR
jgi:pantoate--beta-alanine ligase